MHFTTNGCNMISSKTRGRDARPSGGSLRWADPMQRRWTPCCTPPGCAPQRAGRAARADRCGEPREKEEIFAKLSGTSVRQKRCDVAQDARGLARVAGPVLRRAPPRRGPRPAAGGADRGQAVPHRLCRVCAPVGRRARHGAAPQLGRAARRAQNGNAVCAHRRRVPAQAGGGGRRAGFCAHPAGLLRAAGARRPRRAAGRGHDGMPPQGRHALRPAGAPHGRPRRADHRDAAV